jgi:hydrogenase 3 maturation protease
VVSPAPHPLARRLEALTRGHRVAVVGVGQRLRGDDGVGPEVARALRERGAARVFDVGCVPENHLGTLLEARVDRVLFVDAADWGAAPGAACVARAEELADRCASTHAMSLTLLARLLAVHGIECWLVGVQPADLRLGAALSPPVIDAAHALVEALAACLPAPSEALHA